MPNDMQDDDIFLVFHKSETNPGRFNAVRYPWYKLKQYFGAAGPKGDKGDTGPQGLTGPKGDTGQTGTQGIQGPRGTDGAVGPKGDTGIQGLKGDTGSKGDPGQPRRVERFTGTTNASGLVTITYPTPFTVTPDVDVIEVWNGEQMVSGGIASSTPLGCTAKIMVSRGTLLLNSGPFQAAPAGITATVRAIGY